MFGNRDKKRILRLTEELVGRASMQALFVDKAICKAAQDTDATYPPMKEEYLFLYTIAGAGMAIETAKDSQYGVIAKVGVDRFYQALDNGRLGQQQIISKVIPVRRELFQKSAFEALLMEYSDFFLARFRELSSSVSVTGLWLWKHIQRDLLPTNDVKFGEKVVQIGGTLIEQVFAPYWLTQSGYKAAQARAAHKKRTT